MQDGLFLKHSTGEERREGGKEYKRMRPKGTQARYFELSHGSTLNTKYKKYSQRARRGTLVSLEMDTQEACKAEIISGISYCLVFRVSPKALYLFLERSELMDS